MADKLTISELADVLAAVKEVTEPHQLGIQLKIDPSELDTIEKNHPRDIDRQKTEVIKYWLRNSPDASWTTLANAVERLGGHARLAGRLREEITSEKEDQNTSTIDVERMGGCAETSLREKEQSIMGDGEQEQTRKKSVVLPPPLMLPQQTSDVQPSGKPRSSTLPLNMCVPCNILLFGKMGHGTSTLGNRMLNSDGCFMINDQQPQTSQGTAMLQSESQFKNYRIRIYDHSGLFEGASTIDKISIVPEKLNLVIFILKRDCEFDVSEVEILRSVMSEWQISRISALVLTHCERSSEEERREMIEQFKKDHPSITELMGKGILAVGFPDSSLIPSGSPLSQRVEEDKANLRKLIYSCDEPVLIPQLNPQSETRQPPQNENRRHLCCLIL